MIDADFKELSTDKEELYITISLREYRKLLKRATKLKAKKTELEDIIKDQEGMKAETYERWWTEERAETKKLKAELEAAKAKITELQVAMDILKKEPTNAES
jgi:hypothetical protein